MIRVALLFIGLPWTLNFTIAHLHIFFHWHMGLRECCLQLQVCQGYNSCILWLPQYYSIQHLKNFYPAKNGGKEQGWNTPWAYGCWWLSIGCRYDGEVSMDNNDSHRLSHHCVFSANVCLDIHASHSTILVSIMLLSLLFHSIHCAVTSLSAISLASK